METNNIIIEQEVISLQQKIDVDLFDNKHVLITGCNGLIGSYLLHFFYELSKTKKIKVSCTSFSKELSNVKFSTELINTVNYFSWDASTAIDKNFVKTVDYVYYCSGYAQPARFIKDPAKTALINTLGLTSVMGSLKDKAAFIYMSSSEIYGDPDKDNIPTKETYNGNYSIESNRACYITSKRLGEVLCLSEKERLNIKICRISLTYGPGTDYTDERVIQHFIRKAETDKKINLLDDGAAIRTWCYIKDSVEMVLHVSLKGQQTIYNITTNGNSISILQLAKLIGKFLNVDVSARDNKDDIISKNSPLVVLLNIDRYLSEFKKTDFVTTETGIANILKYFKLIN